MEKSKFELKQPFNFVIKVRHRIFATGMGVVVDWKQAFLLK